MIIARLLTPDEVGTFAVASAIVMIMAEFRILGASLYLIREKEISEFKIKSALGLTILISWGLGASIILLSGSVAEYYDLPPIEVIFKILSISFFFAPYLSIPSAILTRNFQFKTIFIVKVTGASVALLITLILAYLEYSYFALAWGYTSGILASFFVMTCLRPSDVPYLPTFTNIKKVAVFGVHSSLGGVLRKMTLSLPDLVIGKMGTTTQVGLFSRGLGFIDFSIQSLMQGIKPVALPYFSQSITAQSNPNQGYIKLSVLVSGIICPALAVISLTSLPVIRLFFGDQWDFSAPLASILSFWGLFKSIHWFSDSLMTATNNEKYLIPKESVILLVYFLGVFFSFPYGLKAIAFSFVIGSLFEVIFKSLLLRKLNDLQLLVFYRAWVPTLLITVSCFLCTYILGIWINFQSEDLLMPILSVLVILPIVWIISLKIFSHSLYFEIVELCSCINKKLL
jgi:O-antigen/teichoic acid export membrane protein